MTNMELTPISTSGITGAITDSTATLNYNFNQLTDFVNAKADTNGSTTETFNVADATLSTQAVNKGQLDSTVSTLNTTITGLGSTLSTLNTAITNLDTTYADVSLSNLNVTAKEKVANLAMPSNTLISLTLGANGSTYTAPANGYLYIDKFTAATNQYFMITTDAGGNVAQPYLSGSEIMFMVPMRKGAVARCMYNASGVTTLFCFIYAQGEV